MAQGSQKKWGGYEPRVCAVCEVRITLAHSHAMHCFNGGVSFSLCGAHVGSYAAVRRAHELAGRPLNVGAHESRGYETWLEGLKDHGP